MMLACGSVVVAWRCAVVVGVVYAVVLVCRLSFVICVSLLLRWLLLRSWPPTLDPLPPPFPHFPLPPLRQVPNIDFWRAFPGYVASGFKYTGALITKPCSKKKGYDEV